VRTIKDVNFMGPRSEYVVSGSGKIFTSFALLCLALPCFALLCLCLALPHHACAPDDGKVYIWSSATGKLVNVLDNADEQVVNVVASHPVEVMLATSGIDNDVKIWAPTATCVEACERRLQATHARIARTGQPSRTQRYTMPGSGVGGGGTDLLSQLLRAQPSSGGAGVVSLLQQLLREQRQGALPDRSDGDSSSGEEDGRAGGSSSSGEEEEIDSDELVEDEGSDCD
jgi:hypothetical protein